MKHSTDELLDIVRQHYPRGVRSIDPSYKSAPESLRLSAARRQAGAANEAWRALLKRLAEQFPEHSVQNRSLHLPKGDWDACYSGALHLSERHWIGFLVSFLAPSYILYSSRIVADSEASSSPPPEVPRDTVDVYAGNTMTATPRASVTPELGAALERQQERYRKVFTGATPFAPDWAAAGDAPRQRQVIRFDFSGDEARYAEWLARDIEATFGCERMPPEVGNIIVPNVATNAREIGEATLYDALFTETW